MNGLSLQETRLAVARFCADDELYDAIKNGSQDQRLITEINKINDCLALVLSEIVNDYFYVYTSENIKVTNGFFAFNDLTERVVEVISVKQNGTQKNYKIRTDGILIQDGEYEINYAYEPKFDANTTTYPLYGRLTSRIVALGTVAEYLLISDRINEATAFNDRFKDALVSVEKKRTGLKVKGRRWL